MDYKSTIDALLEVVVREGGSDLHLSEDRHPNLRTSGMLLPLLKTGDALEGMKAFMEKREPKFEGR